jgi:hypothetical protein
MEEGVTEFLILDERGGDAEVLPIDDGGKILGFEVVNLNIFPSSWGIIGATIYFCSCSGS